MSGRLYVGLWVWYTLFTCLNVFWVFVDINGHDWWAFAIDTPLTLLFFIAAHHTWEKGYYEK